MRKSIFSAAILALMLMSCNEKKNIHGLLQDETSKNEIFTEITSDYELMKEFTAKMVNSGSAIDVLQDDPEMVNHLINSDGMVDLLKNNPQAKEQMMTRMLKDTMFTSQLIEKAMQEPSNISKMVKQLEDAKIISEGCVVDANNQIAKRSESKKPAVKKN